MTSGLPFAFAYVGGLLVASSSFDEHLQHLRLLYERLQANAIIIKSGKSEFEVDALPFLGHYVDTGAVHRISGKVKAVVEFPQPTSLTKIRQRQGLVTFYRRFVRISAALLETLDRLLYGTQHSATLAWDSAVDDAFLALKGGLAEATLLIHPNPDCPLVLMTDA